MKSFLEYPESRLVFNYYQDWTPTTAIYADENAESYLISGLAAEYCEFLNANGENVKKELGDIFWFLSQIGNLFGFRLGDAVEWNKFPPAEGDAMENFFSAYAKAVRKGFLFNEIREAIRVQFNELVLSTVVFVEDNKWSVTKILAANQDKLESRKERGVIEGVGDHR
jgi:hypothetical protein